MIPVTDALIAPLFDALPDGVCLADARGRVLYLNPAAERLLGLRAERVQGQDLCGALCGRLQDAGGKTVARDCPLFGDSGAQAVTFTGRHGPNVSFEWRGLSMERHERFGHLRVRCLRLRSPLLGDADAERHLVFIEDASAELELEQRREEWRHMIAHDLRAPLTNAFATLRLLQDSPDKLDADQRSMVASSVRGCEQVLRMLDAYLDLAKLDAGKMPVVPQRIALFDLLAEGIEAQRPFAEGRGVTVELDLPAELEAWADRDLLGRVFQNILHNALKFSPKGGAVIVGGAREPDGGAAFWVRDSGPGISPEEMKTLFGRFQQGKAGRGQGAGLGLAFCRQALKAMEGEVDVKSAPRKGATFTVRLPAAPEAKP